MSAVLTVADDLKTYLESVISADELSVVVDRQKDLASEVKKNLARVKGGVAVIDFTGASNEKADDDKGVQLKASYTISLVSKPLLRSGDTPADELVERVMSAVQGWDNSARGLCFYGMNALSVQLITTSPWLVYEIKCTKLLPPLAI